MMGGQLLGRMAAQDMEVRWKILIFMENAVNYALIFMENAVNYALNFMENAVKLGL